MWLDHDVSNTTCTKCHGTGVRTHPFNTNGKACDCGWQEGGALRLAAEVSYQAELAARSDARAARRAARAIEAILA